MHAPEKAPKKKHHGAPTAEHKTVQPIPQKPRLYGAAHLGAGPEEFDSKYIVAAMPVPTPPKKQEKQRLSAEEIAALRVQHGISYEKEHDVEHYIEKATHPQYEITG